MIYEQNNKIIDLDLTSNNSLSNNLCLFDFKGSLKAVLSAKVEFSSLNDPNYFLQISKTEDFISYISIGPQKPDEFNLMKFEIENLEPNTKYCYRLLESESNDLSSNSSSSSGL
jgi:hypothetical protein